VTADAAKSEKDRLYAIEKANQRAADGLKGYLLAHLERHGRDKVDTVRCRLRRVANSQPTIRWTKGEDELPASYRRITVTPDLAAVREDLKAGAEIPEGFTVVVGHHLRIS
jgi:hypothetical protein